MRPIADSGEIIDAHSYLLWMVQNPSSCWRFDGFATTSVSLRFKPQIFQCARESEQDFFITYNI